MAENVIDQKVTKRSVKGSYAIVNGINLYYETYGTRNAATPLIMLHGGLGVIGMFDKLLPALAHGRQVIAVELQAHGHTADIDRPMTFEAMADDIAALIKHLGLGKADLLGYSMGGGVALRTAIRHPGVVRKLVIVSTPCKLDGWYPSVQEGFKAMNGAAARGWIGSPMHEAYASVAPRPEDWPQLADKLGQLVSQNYDWSVDVAMMKMPTLIAIGDADAVRTAHAVEIFELLGGGKAEAGWDGSGMPHSRLAILPGTTHYDIVFSPALSAAVEQFLDAAMPEDK
jgi:pimeloyl-ACP methyl ester carboxylesterase